MMVKFPPVDQQMQILMRGVDFGDQLTYANMERELYARLQESNASGRPLKVYCGYDPSSPDLHLGHTITMRKLRQFQELGHEVTFLIGTFTGIIGDPTDRDSARRQQTLEEALAKAESYANQAFIVLDRDQTKVRYNHEWLASVDFAKLIHLASNFTLQQFLARENFAKRHNNGDPIWLHEFFYALMQGYDAVALETDVQIGGTDQLFNLMAGRKLMESYNMKPQIVLTTQLLVGTDGVQKMSKSLGNYIGISEAPGIIFTKVLNVQDEAIRSYAELATRWSVSDISAHFDSVARSELSMRELKHKLAWEIVSIFHGNVAADKAAADAARMHQGEAPSDARALRVNAPMNIIDLLVAGELVSSRSEGRRLVEQGGVRVDGEVVATIDTTVASVPGRERTLQAGKRKFLRLQE
jgi:tyrosyl-tRNA synthetase